jgi:hypothetical protein
VGSRWQAGDFSGRRVEARHSIIVAGDGLAIDDAGRERNLAKESTIKGKRLCQVVARPAVERTRSPSLRATTRKPSCLISCSQSGPDGLVGGHGAMEPAGRVRTRQHDSRLPKAQANCSGLRSGEVTTTRPSISMFPASYLAVCTENWISARREAEAQHAKNLG